MVNTNTTYDSYWDALYERLEFVVAYYNQLWCLHICSIFIPTFIPVSRVDRFFYWTPVGLIPLYFLLLAILKRRAASQWKIGTLPNTDNRDETENTLVTGLKKIFYSEAKMAPCIHPFLSTLWRFLGYRVVHELFPRRVVYVYFIVAWLSYVFQAFMSACLCDRSKWVNDLAYNGRRFRAVWLGAHYSTLQDENQNILYYPTIDLYGLVASRNL
ncbi:hypothetical protein PSACC_01069 [Paramicrosporidium saccamoebae]|uniref:Uncharacterized protein n=1 Tax=Paramicrosporidium saccamoebae TaxID=1246581 RepID=A0A2H9TMX5_9FUNG|nr:hypothetical protein PSACC_01069 [Paramicrosporidium saccamoebae]